MKELRVVIAEDWGVFRELIRRALSEIEGCNVIGIAKNGLEALQLVRELKPQLLVLDNSMPYMSGLAVLEEIRREDSATVIVMFTADHSIRKQCLESGASFFLYKSQLAELKSICRTILLAT